MLNYMGSTIKKVILSFLYIVFVYIIRVQKLCKVLESVICPGIGHRLSSRSRLTLKGLNSSIREMP